MSTKAAGNGLDVADDNQTKYFSCLLHHQPQTALSELAASRRRKTKANSHCGVPKFLSKWRWPHRQEERGHGPKLRQVTCACPQAVHHSPKPQGS